MIGSSCRLCEQPTGDGRAPTLPLLPLSCLHPPIPGDQAFNPGHPLVHIRTYSHCTSLLYMWSKLNLYEVLRNDPRLQSLFLFWKRPLSPPWKLKNNAKMYRDSTIERENVPKFDKILMHILPIKICSNNAKLRLQLGFICNDKTCSTGLVHTFLCVFLEQGGWGFKIYYTFCCNKKLIENNLWKRIKIAPLFIL